MILRETLLLITLETHITVKKREQERDRIRAKNITTNMLVFEYLEMKYELVQVNICKGEEPNAPYCFKTNHISRIPENTKPTKLNRL